MSSYGDSYDFREDPESLRGWTVDQLRAESNRLAKIISGWEVRGGDQVEYNRVVSRASVINNLVNQRDAAMRGLEAGHYEVAFDQRDRGLPPAGHGGWISAPDADPRLSQYRSAAMRTIDTYQRRSVLDSTAADRLDDVLRSGDPTGHTARYLSAVGNDHLQDRLRQVAARPNAGSSAVRPGRGRGGPRGVIRAGGHPRPAPRC